VTPPPDEPTEGGPEDEDSASNGWIDPDDRLWRHPSEVAGGPGTVGASTGPGPDATATTWDVRRNRIMMLVGAMAVAAAAVWIGILLTQDVPHPTKTSVSDAASDAPLTTMAGISTPIPPVADAAGDAMVELRATTDHGTFTLVGVAVAEGGQVATTASDLSGLRSIEMVGPDGRLLHSSVVAIDHKSDIALVNVPDDLPVPPFSDDVGLSNGSVDMTLTTATTSSGAVALHAVPGTVTAIGQAIPTGPASGMPGITSSALGAPAHPGDLLLNGSGAVLGIYYTGNTATSASTFLPTELVLGVADDLRSNGQVNQGWLGISGSDAAGQTGVDVAQVMPGSPAAGHLQPGDVVASLNSVPIRTMADLRGRLYVLPPSTQVTLSVHQGSASDVVGVTLSASP
jgi:S1-C subfamily serine protease